MLGSWSVCLSGFAVREKVVSRFHVHRFGRSSLSVVWMVTLLMWFDSLNMASLTFSTVFVLGIQTLYALELS